MVQRLAFVLVSRIGIRNLTHFSSTSLGIEKVTSNFCLCKYPFTRIQYYRFFLPTLSSVLSTAEPTLLSTLLLVICRHNINACVRCIGWLDICFTSERCNSSSMNKRATRVAAAFKNSTVLGQGQLKLIEKLDRLIKKACQVLKADNYWVRNSIPDFLLVFDSR